MMVRSDYLDRVRGAAIVLMVVDHCLAFMCELASWPLDAGAWAARYTLTRAALPLFMLLAGALLAGRNPSRRRVGEVLAAGVAAQWLASGLPFMASVNIIPIIGLALVVWPLVRRSGLWGVVVCMVLVSTFGRFPGYHPAHVLGLMLLGSVLGRGPLERLGACFEPWVAVVGRHPLAWYLGHLAALWGAWWWVSHMGASDLPRTAGSRPPGEARLVTEWVSGPGPSCVGRTGGTADRGTRGCGLVFSGMVIAGNTQTSNFFAGPKVLSAKGLPALHNM